MYVEIHMLQNFAPSNLNRDDTNSPKDCTFGGFRRARISSQCLKRAIRTDAGFIERLEGNVGRRTKLVHERLVAALVDKGRAPEGALERVKRAFEAVKFKWDADKDRTSVLLFVSDGELARWADAIDEHWDALGGKVEPASEAEPEKKGKRKTAKQEKSEKAATVPAEATRALKEAMRTTNGHAVDIALFGRMVAENTDMNVDAACQVAHAISTHAVQMEMDFFTAVDDLQPKEDTGAGMMGVVEFNSACFYRYAVIDLGQLARNIGDQALTKDAALAFCEAMAHAIPSGKQNSFAARNPPDWVRVEVRRAPRSLVNAFSEPVRVGRNEGDLVGQSIAKALGYAHDIDAMLGDDAGNTLVGMATTRRSLVEGAVDLKALWQRLGGALDAMELA